MPYNTRCCLACNQQLTEFNSKQNFRSRYKANSSVLSQNNQTGIIITIITIIIVPNNTTTHKPNIIGYRWQKNYI